MPPGWTPTVAEVAAVVVARTRDNNGNELGTFTANTRPTDAQVTELAASAADDVADVIGPDANLPADVIEMATKVAAVGAAMAVELTFFPEQLNSGRSSYPQLEKMYNDRLARLKARSAAEGAEAPADEYMHPAGAFGGNPLPIRWFTEW